MVSTGGVGAGTGAGAGVGAGDAPSTRMVASAKSLRPWSSVTVRRTRTSPLEPGATNEVWRPASALRDVAPPSSVQA